MMGVGECTLEQAARIICGEEGDVDGGAECDQQSIIYHKFRKDSQKGIS
jgi:hypothetical protein